MTIPTNLLNADLQEQSSDDVKTEIKEVDIQDFNKKL